MGLFGFMKKNRELTEEQIAEKCVNGTIEKEDVADMRAINALHVAQSLLDTGNEEAAARLAELATMNRPSLMIGRFVAENPQLEVEGMEAFKNLLDTREERAVFCALYREGYITNANIGEVTDEMQEKMDLAFEEEAEGGYMFDRTEGVEEKETEWEWEEEAEL